MYNFQSIFPLTFFSFIVTFFSFAKFTGEFKYCVYKYNFQIHIFAIFKSSTKEEEKVVVIAGAGEGKWGEWAGGEGGGGGQ